ncbi:MAG: threonine--tRNA ligase [Candidatus Aenigmarchaeota archaeon]|nr:threonine--tRNA ligase [Candidatus Aenigmarchaeota archaeon]
MEGLKELAAHIVAKAVKEVFPEAKLGDFEIGKEKSYYEFKIKPLKAKDVEEIQKRIDEISKNVEYEVLEQDTKAAKSLFKNEEYKQLILENHPGKVSIIKINGFFDVCKHVPEGKEVFIKVLNVSSSYWKLIDDAMQRVWFVAFPNKEQLEEYVQRLEELKKRDHRYIGEKLDLFHVEEIVVGPGLPIIHPKGMVIRNELIKFMREVNDEMGFQEVWTPHLAKTILWKISGHYQKYVDKMFMWDMDDEEWSLKPMNCPLHIQIYKFKPRSYRDLPIRFSEFATVYRKEQSGELHGLARVWSLTQDDHHVIARPDQIKQEIKNIVKSVIKVYDVFKLEYKVNLSTKPEKYIGSDDLWELAEKSLKEVLEEMRKEVGLRYEVKEGEGAFYGPKIDFDVKDVMGRWWQLATIQLDFFMPQRFELSYVDKDGKEKRPVMIHLAILGSLERFMAMIIEHFGGRFPVWLAPIQVRIIPVSQNYVSYASQLLQRMKKERIRVDMDEEGTVEYRVRNAEIEKIPYIVIVGKREAESGKLAVRKAGKVSVLGVDEFISKIKEEIDKRLIG